MPFRDPRDRSLPRLPPGQILAPRELVAARAARAPARVPPVPPGVRAGSQRLLCVRAMLARELFCGGGRACVRSVRCRFAVPARTRPSVLSVCGAMAQVAPMVQAAPMVRQQRKSSGLSSNPVTPLSLGRQGHGVPRRNQLLRLRRGDVLIRAPARPSPATERYRDGSWMQPGRLQRFRSSERGRRSLSFDALRQRRSVSFDSAPRGEA